MNKKLYIFMVAALAFKFTLFSCKPPSTASDESLELSGSKSKEQMEARRPKPLSNKMIESVADLEIELNQVVQGKDDSRVIESVLMHSKSWDNSVEKWDGTSVSLATRFSEFFPNGNPNSEFFEKFGLAERDSGQKPRVEVEVIVRTIGSLALNRPDLLQELLVRKSMEATQAESDLVVFAATLDSVMENSAVFRRTGYNGITSLRVSENPIYRLLAAKLMPVLELDLRSLAEFYRPYVAENDETILLIAIDGLATSGTSEALEILRKIIAKNRDESSKVTDSAKRALELVAARQSEE